SWVEVLLRALGFSILWNLGCKILRRPKVELPKQAMRKSRLLVLLALTTHIIPVGGVATLTYLVIRGYYIGGTLAGPDASDDLKLSGLQFAAKLHELMMQASLSLVVVSFIRHELVAGNGVPFGAIFGSVQFTTPSYLWSKEFMGTLKARFRSSYVKWSLIILVVIASVLFVTVGPSTAIIMRPRLSNWPAGGSQFYLNATEDQLWPQTITAADATPGQFDDWAMIPDTVLPFWSQLNNRNPLPEIFELASEETVRQLYPRSTLGLYKKSWTLTTTQMSCLADAVDRIGRLWIDAAVGAWLVKKRKYSNRFKWRQDVRWSISNVQQPLTMTVCSSYGNETFANGIFVPKVETNCGSDGNSLVTESVSFTQLSQLDSVMTNYNNPASTSPALQFVELPTAAFGRNSIGAFISFPSSWPGGKRLLACGVDARWVPSVIQGQRSAVKRISGQPYGPFDLLGTCNLPKTRRVIISPEWANSLNPTIHDSNRTVIQEIMQDVPETQGSRWKNISTGQNGDKFVVPFIEMVLSMLVTNGLSRTAASAVPQGILKGCSAGSCASLCSDGDGAWCTAIMPDGEFGYRDNQSIFTLPANADLSKMTPFNVRIDITGYAYSIRGTTARLSCAVLLLYCSLAVIHTCFTLWTGLTSQSWDTISEIVALAMQSQPTQVLRNTCAGIVTTTVFKRFVKVGTTGRAEDHLELLFEDDEDERLDAMHIEPGRYYG
ncbi:hypothetical protein BCR34DRAFT_476003, partial [Clohesyomyces aquaticus]